MTSPSSAFPPFTPARAPCWQDVPWDRWNDWQWQQAHRLRTAEALGQVLRLTSAEKMACARATERFRLAVTPYYASLMDPDDPKCPVRRQGVPDLAELRVGQGEREDPLAEEDHMPVPGLTHRYPDRALLYTTHNCPVYCRYCFRKRKVSDPTSAASRAELEVQLTYLRAHPEVRDVLVSGGDPLTFSDVRLGALLEGLRRISHIEIVRLATRNPVTLPQRITPELADLLKQYQPIYVMTHFNHPAEGTDESALALERLADAGCVLNNQMVLLRGINDAPEVVRRLNHWLLKHRCRPYYIFQCDAAQGTEHFRTPIARGLEIIDRLRGWTSGLAVPHYVIDLPGGGGKVPLQPEYLVARSGRTYTFRNYAGSHFNYIEGEDG